MPAFTLRDRRNAPRTAFAARVVVPLALAAVLAAPTAALAGMGVTGGAGPMAGAPPYRHVVASGTTKPDGAAVDARLGTSPRLVQQSLQIDRQIRMAICAGC